MIQLVMRMMVCHHWIVALDQMVDKVCRFVLETAMKMQTVLKASNAFSATVGRRCLDVRDEVYAGLTIATVPQIPNQPPHPWTHQQHLQQLQDLIQILVFVSLTLIEL